MTFQHMVVPYEGGALSEDALRIACHLVLDESRITAVYVVPVAKDMPASAEKPLEETARESLERAEAVGRALGVDVETDVA